MNVKNAGASGAGTRAEIEAALSALAGAVDRQSRSDTAVVAAEFSRWLETSKYLGAKHNSPGWSS